MKLQLNEFLALIQSFNILLMYIVSDEYAEFVEPRKILDYKEVQINKRKAFLVTIDRYVLGQKYGLGGAEITQLYLIDRFGEITDSFNKRMSPIEVHVLIPIAIKINYGAYSLDQLQNIAWASLFLESVDF